MPNVKAQISVTISKDGPYIVSAMRRSPKR